MSIPHNNGRQFEAFNSPNRRDTIITATGNVYVRQLSRGLPHPIAPPRLMKESTTPNIARTTFRYYSQQFGANPRDESWTRRDALRSKGGARAGLQPALYFWASRI